MKGVYQVTPDTGDGFRMGIEDPVKRFYPKADGTWPSGIPGDPNARFYDRAGGYYEKGKGVVPAVQNNTPRDLSLAYMQANGNDTSTMIRASDGMVYADLPEGTRSFILGPLVTSYTQNHMGFGLEDDFTNLGYIQKDTRQFVLLGRIEGFLDGAKRLDGGARTWDGTAAQFTSYNSNFKIEHALWMKERYNEGNFTANVPFNLSGGIPADRHPDDNSKGGGDVLGSDGGQQGGDNDDIGTPQGPPDDNDIESLDLWGLIKKKAREFGDRFDKAVEDGIAELVDALGDKFNEVMDGVIENLGKVTGMESAANMLNRYDDFLKNNPNGSDERIDVTNEFSARDLNKLNDVRNDSTVNDAINKAIEVNNDPERANKVTNTGQTVGDILWELAADKVRDKLQDAVYSTGGLDNSIHNNVQIDFDEFKNSGGEDWTIIKNYEFRPGGSVEGAEDTPLGSALTSAGVELDSLGAGSIPVVVGAVIAAKTGITGANQHGGLYNSPTMKYKVKVPKTRIKPNQGGQGGRPLGSTTDRGGVIESRTFDKKRILREIRQPLKEIQELPKTTKLKGYRPNFKGRFSPQNTPDVTASKISDDIVSAKNSSRQIWTAKDKFWKGYETTERMNIIYDNLGHGSQYFDRIVDENVRLKGKKTREVQEHLNMLAHQKALREVYGIKEYEDIIDESETFDNKINDPLFSKVAKRLKKEIDYPKKPAAKGYPNKPPAKIDPNTGMHPKYGKRYKYDKLDPHSAESMPMQGDQEIDSNIEKATDRRRKARKLKNLLGKK